MFCLKAEVPHPVAKKMTLLFCLINFCKINLHFQNEVNMSLFDFWDAQWNDPTNKPYPWDLDFRFVGNQYADIELTGELWDPYCNPEVIQFNQFFTTNNGQPIQYTSWRAIRWLPNPGGLIPEHFVVKSYKVIIYSDAVRTSILETHEGNFSIDDSKLIDEHGWFPSKFVGCTPSQSLPLDSELNIYCDILQPRTSELEISLSVNNQPFGIIQSTTLNDMLRVKRYSFDYSFDSWGIYKFRFRIKTLKQNWIDNWCPPNDSYVEIAEATITVGEQ